MSSGQTPTIVRGTSKRITVSSWVGMSLNQFRLTSYLGAGSTGKVYRAEDRVLGRSIAVKIFPQSRSGGTEAFLREAKLGASLEHPYITRLYQIGRWGSWLYIAMELVDGGDAGQLVDAGGPLPVSRAAQLCAQAADALAYAHRRGVVHCDVKPANLLLTRAGDCKLSDFGLARLIDRFDMSEQPMGFVGTPLYLSPELAQGIRPEPTADIYSLGATLWHLLCGAPPFSSGTPREIVSQHVRGRLPDIRTLRPDLPAGLVDLLRRSLAKNTADRLSNAADFASALKAYTVPETDAIQLSIPSLPDIAPPQRSSVARHVPAALRRFGWLTGSGVVAAAVTLVAVWSVGSNAPPAPSAARAALLATPEPRSTEPTVATGGPAVVKTFSVTDTLALNQVIKAGDTRTYAVRGVVKSVVPSSTGKTFRIEFEGIRSGGFYAVGLGEAVDQFSPGAPGAESKLVGKSVILRGTLRSSVDGPRIMLRNLEQISFTGGSP